MKFVITTFEENIREVVVAIVDANSIKEIREELITLTKPYLDALESRDKMCEKYGSYSKKAIFAEKQYMKISHSKIKYKTKEFPIYIFSYIDDYNIIPLDDFIKKYEI